MPRQPTMWGRRGEILKAKEPYKTYGVPSEYHWAFMYPTSWDGDLRPKEDIRWIVKRLRQGPWYADHGVEVHSLNLELGVTNLEVRMDEAREKDPHTYWRAMVEDEWRL